MVGRKLKEYWIIGIMTVYGYCSQFSFRFQRDNKLERDFRRRVGTSTAIRSISEDQMRRLDSARGRRWFRAFGWSGGVVLGGFWVGRDLGGMGRPNRTQCSWSGVVLGVWVVVRGGLGWFWGG